MKEKRNEASACAIKTSIGGQALMEGIMMRGPKVTAMAVRNTKGEIVVEESETKGIKRPKICRLPIIRGIFGYIDSMAVGYKALMRSAELSGLEDVVEESPKKKKKREAEEAKRAAAAKIIEGENLAMPESTNYTYVSKTVKLIFRRPVDPNITGRIHEIIKQTLVYYKKEKVHIRIKATVPDTDTVCLQFLQIPLEEMELLSNIIKILGKSNLGIAKAIVD